MQGQLTKKQFDVLRAFLKGTKYTQRELCEKTELSLGTVNGTLKELNDRGYIRRGEITQAGIEAMAPYQVKRAVFLAAGFGSRLVPITLNTPKPLVRVKGKRIIDTLLDAVLAAEITEIYIVRGYLAEQFDQLLYQYPMIKFIENPAYNEANNISSAMYVRDLLSGSYVFDADLYLSNSELIQPYQYSSNIVGIKKERTDDWCLKTTENGTIVEQVLGGTNCYLEIGIYYVSEKDGKRLKEDIKTAYEMPGGKERYWDQVPLGIFKNKYQFKVRECAENDVVEIDTFRDLKEFDATYRI